MCCNKVVHALHDYIWCWIAGYKIFFFYLRFYHINLNLIWQHCPNLYKFEYIYNLNLIICFENHSIEETLGNSYLNISNFNCILNILSIRVFTFSLFCKIIIVRNIIIISVLWFYLLLLLLNILIIFGLNFIKSKLYLKCYIKIIN